MSKRKILIVEDDRIIANGLSRALNAEGYDAAIARDGDAGLKQVQIWQPDLIILDIMMPFINGFELTTEMRRVGNKTPIIMLSARTSTKDKVRGLDLGADDYLSKPFDIEELLARVRRRIGPEQDKPTIVGLHTFDWNTGLLQQQDSQAVIPLNAKETLLLTYLLRNKMRVVSRAQIIEAVWGDDYEGTDRTVDNFVALLRRKIGSDLIETVRGLGYRYTGA